MPLKVNTELLTWPRTSPAVVSETIFGSVATTGDRAGVNVLFFDGHAAFVRDGVAPPPWRPIATRAGGEIVTRDAP